MDSLCQWVLLSSLQKQLNSVLEILMQKLVGLFSFGCLIMMIQGSAA